PAPGRELLGSLEGAVAVAQEDAHAARDHHGQVGPAVTVEVPHGDGARSGAGEQAAGRLKGSIAVAQEEAQARIVRHHEVRDAVAVEIPHRYNLGIMAHLVGPWSDE